jgi:WD40 repeat protein
LIFGDNEKNLILRDGRTGAIEKVIDCDVASNITDFAWHPKGRFIAVTFEEHNIRIIDIDEAKIVADLSAQHLLGWNPDGKILAARTGRGKDDFVIWDALEAREKPMPDDMKTEIWFKRFSKNISADGLRYVKYVCDENHNCSTNIYSVASDELVATLPKPVN